jgi:hypothetical protein
VFPFFFHKEKKSLLKNADVKNLILVWTCSSFLIFKEKTDPTGLVSHSQTSAGRSQGGVGMGCKSSEEWVRMDLFKSVQKPCSTV